MGCVRQRLPGVNWDELYYADDTVIMGQSTINLNRLIAEIEGVAEEYGLNLNRKKCVALVANGQADLKFRDGSKIPQAAETTYLGIQVGRKPNPKREIQVRMATVMQIWNKLFTFWREGDVSTRTKMLVFDAIVRSKLVYGLESMCLGANHRSQMDAFQLKGLRRILRLDTTFINRANTNKVVFLEANKAVGWKPGAGPLIRTFSSYLNSKSVKLCAHVLRASDQDVLRQVCFWKGSNRLKMPASQQVGRPRGIWVAEQMKAMWPQALNLLGELEGLPAGTKFDWKNEEMLDLVALACDLHVF